MGGVCGALVLSLSAIGRERRGVRVDGCPVRRKNISCKVRNIMGVLCAAVCFVLSIV